MDCSMQNGFNSFLYPTKHSPDTAPVLPFEVFNLILSYVRRPKDLAALSSTSRVLHWLTAPKLFDHVWLDTSTDQLLQGLAALQNTTYSSLVRKLEVRGDGLRNDREMELLAFAVGGTMGGMRNLETFHWRCRRRVPRSLYQTLTLSTTLKTLVVEFGKGDRVMNGFLLPAFKSLRSLTITGIDCEQTEDWSRVLLSCGGIKELRLGWASSFEEQERVGGGLSNVLKTLIERVRLAERYRTDSAMSGMTVNQAFDLVRRIPLEELELQNLYVPEHDATLESLFDLSTLTRLGVLGCQINSCWPYKTRIATTASSPAASSSSGGLPTPRSMNSGSSEGRFAPKKGSPPTQEPSKAPLPAIKIFRSDSLSQWTIKVLGACGPKLEGIYLLDPTEITELCKDDIRMGLVQAISEHKNLQKLRLSARMLLLGKDFVRIARGCPLLREWGLCTEPSQKHIFSLTFPFMTLKTCAFLYSPLLTSGKEYFECYANPVITEDKKKEVEAYLAHEWFQDLKYLGIGTSVFRGDDTIVENLNAEPPNSMSRCLPDGGGYYSRGVTVLGREQWPEGSIFTEGENTLLRV
ncbi:hypothetical protein BJ508DRAFT_17207 [Ascobolus immersus RN42]|uniref:F-box domain-containing protein n=1 Tax=Ascobolus immersus RN42 TaxID=1160509 RepID=A0A3N4HPB1_ASCIM|nr:hypothetical protein BJ508DRAFT_17207 [Ascobolus immersus RN42]